MNGAFRNERSSKNERREMNNRNELEMNRRNEPKMNPQNHVEMNRRNERQKNRRNEPITPTIAVKNFNKLNQTNIQKGDDNMQINVTDIKLKLQGGYTGYLIGIKYVTYETPDIVLKSIEKDLRIYKNVGFIVQDNTIFLQLDNNATLCAYYFLKEEVFAKVVKELPKFQRGITKLSKD